MLTKNIFLIASSLLLLGPTLLAQSVSLVPAWVSYIPNTNLSVRDVHSDCVGNVVYVGGTGSSTFQCTPGTINTAYHGGNSDVFVVKLDSSGQLLWATLLGGNQYDRAYAVEVDDAGFIYVAGRAGNGLQTTDCALQQNFAGDNNPNPAYGIQDGFVTKITPDGATIVWSTYIGCDGMGFVRDIDLDSKGNVWAAMSVVSPNFPYTTANAVQPNATNALNPALIKLSADGKRILFGTFLADGVHDGGRTTIRIDKQDNAFFLSHASANNLPVTPGAFQPTIAGDDDFVLSKFDSTGHLLFCSFLGGSGQEEVETHSLEVDRHGNPIVAAYTFSSTDYPVVGPVFQNAYKGGREGVITKVSSDGSAILASSYLGGAGLDEIEGIGLDSNDVIYVSGTTMSPDFPISNSTAYQANIGGNRDGYLAVLAPDLSTLLYATFIGGNGSDNLRACHVDHWGRVHAGGISASANYPVFDPFQASLTGANTGVAVALKPTGLLQLDQVCSINNLFSDPCLVSGLENLKQHDLLIFPNPATTFFTIKSDHPFSVQKLELFDLSGRLILSKANLTAGIRIDVSQLARGAYMVKLITENGVLVWHVLLS